MSLNGLHITAILPRICLQIHRIQAIRCCWTGRHVRVGTFQRRCMSRQCSVFPHPSSSGSPEIRSGLKNCHRTYHHLLTFQCRCICRHPLARQALVHLRYIVLSSCKCSEPWKLEWLSIMLVTITVRAAVFHSRSLTRRAPHRFHG